MRKYSHGIRSVEPSTSIKAPRPKPKAELSMYWHDFERWNDVLKSMTQSGIEVRSGEYHKLRFYYESMWTIWAEWEQKIKDYDSNRNEKFKDDFKRIDKNIKDFLSNLFTAKDQLQTNLGIPDSLVEDLRELHISLLRIKEELGLGVWSNRPPSEDELLKDAV